MKTRPYLFRKPLKTLSLFSVLCFLLFTNMKCKKYSPDPGPETLPSRWSGFVIPSFELRIYDPIYSINKTLISPCCPV